ncbi:hybrid sensor histidine kinase/response regulator [Aureimonas jatrophae]|uniref:histidine kinase n=1 Tax=Aureimonas jatrophae TaxID=1166073 RepID=A0A1H0EWB0_9HYPH|nr:response regulator [Aureimonas jatrophae]MBB3950287.1 signal transduction histidine kinase/DNA-binding response OmpR family regulator [Aureimonas jatrophae]SDN86596.1 Signal transduction histidine kinase [Aureimonas jatrophae]
MTSARFLSGEGEMADRMRSADWTATPLGPPAGWPRPLKTMVSLMLASRQPMFLAWGRENGIMLYNDPYIALLQSKHPTAFGQRFRETWGEIWDEIGPLVDRVFAGGSVHYDDIALQVERNGRLEEAHFAFSYTPVYGDDGEVAGLFGACNETTSQILAERAKMEALQAAEEANLAKSQFLANMSHELRTPLSAIIGYSEMLIEEAEEGAVAGDLVRDIRKIESNARHLLGLINDVLDLSKVESGKMDLYAETFDVAEIVADVAATARALAEKKDNRLEIELAGEVGTMHSDITKLRQVLLNLLSNAAKFTQAGTITLRAERLGGTLVFSVSDTGIGMTPEQLERLFQRFAQADASTTRRFGGTGLGLSLTKAFSEMLGGHVSVESRPGEGSTFRLTVPAQLPDTTDRDAAPGAAQLPQGTDTAGRHTVLVIDDDTAQRELMTRFLAREGFAAITAPDGQTGLAMAKEMRPRAILLDVMMPGMDGWTVLARLKADPELAEIPVIMVTFVSERALASSLGASDYVAKPVQWDSFRLVMDRFREEAGDVLVVDDDEDARERLRHALERDGWSVSEAGNGREALDRVEAARPRVILLDLTMPVMDGFSFLDALRSRPEHRDIPVIVLSARSLTREERTRLEGADRVMTKGLVSLSEVASNVRAVTQ